jgi:hypothetical protein
MTKQQISNLATKHGWRTSLVEKNEHTIQTLEQRHRAAREELRVLLIETPIKLIRRMDEPHIDFKGKDAQMVEYPVAPAPAVQHYATSVGIMIDKYRLEMGEATGRSEVSITKGMQDHEREALAGVIRRALEEAEQAEAVPVGDSA